MLRVFRGRGAATGENGRIAGKALYQARFPDHVAAGRNLHGKEGVDGSSPSEGSAKNPLTPFFISDRFAEARMWGRYGALYGAFRSKTPAERAGVLAIQALSGAHDRLRKHR